MNPQPPATPTVGHCQANGISLTTRQPPTIITLKIPQVKLPVAPYWAPILTRNAHYPTIIIVTEKEKKVKEKKENF